jgi:hypothetical protein
VGTRKTARLSPIPVPDSPSPIPRFPSNRRVRIDIKQVPRRSDEGAKEVDRTAKMAGRNPTEVDFGFPKGKVGRPKNNSKKAARLFPAAGQSVIVRPYKSNMARRDKQLFRFEVWDEAKGMFFEKCEAYTSNEIGNELHRQNVYHVRMNEDPRYPQIIEIIWSRKEIDFLARRVAGCDSNTSPDAAGESPKPLTSQPETDPSATDTGN